MEQIIIVCSKPHWITTKKYLIRVGQAQLFGLGLIHNIKHSVHLFVVVPNRENYRSFYMINQFRVLYYTFILQSHLISNQFILITWQYLWDNFTLYYKPVCVTRIYHLTQIFISNIFFYWFHPLILGNQQIMNESLKSFILFLILWDLNAIKYFTC